MEYNADPLENKTQDVEKIPAPKFVVRSNATNLDVRTGNHQANPSWLVCIIPFDEPVASFNSSLDDAMKTKAPIIIQNDCVSVSVSRSKTSTLKSASMTLKLTDIYYQNACSTGDWIAIWMSDWQEDMDRIAGIIKGEVRGSLNDWKSGFKFIGRVTYMGELDSVEVRGVRSVTQSIQAQAFTEMSSSLYYTAGQQAMISLNEMSASGDKSQTQFNAERLQFDDTNLRKALGDTSKTFLDLFRLGSVNTSDQTITNLFIMTMGIPADQNRANVSPAAGLKAFGTPTDAIQVPKIVAAILGKPRAKYLWELYNVYAGLQKYSTKGKTVWERFHPDVDETKVSSSSPEETVFWFSPIRLKGVVPYIPPQWNNTPVWSVLSQYMHPLLNEMFTCLRINRNNQILPSLVIREQPWSTGLFNYLQNGRPMDSVETTATTKTPLSKNTGPKTKKKVMPRTQYDLTQNLERTFFHNIPRWVIDESMVFSVDTTTSEGDRCNFIQVYAKVPGVEQLSQDPQIASTFRMGQLNAGNFVIDEKDIRRHGLKAQTFETDFGDLGSGGLGGSGAKTYQYTPPKATGPNDYVKAEYTGNLTVQYTTGDGSTINYVGGSKAWRNNNPGNIRASEFAVNHGAIGEAGGMAVFPTPEIGFEAIKALFKTDRYASLSVQAGIQKYAPPSENNTVAYQASLKKQTGLDLSRAISSLNDLELEKVANAIKKHEGNISGNIVDVGASNTSTATKVTQTRTDSMAGSNFISPYWAKIKADWLFNGHLKLRGSISCQGIREPVCEGDNLQVRGVVYHIESVAFSGNISATGVRSLKTTFSVSNGLVAEGLDEKRAPLYPVHLGSNPATMEYTPGYTEIQHRVYDPNRKDNGEKS